jgi:hypothetical protein
MQTHKKIILSVLGAALVVGLAVVITILTSSDKPFNRIELNTENKIVNYSKYSYLDTVVYAGLQSLDICGVSVKVKTLTDIHRDNFQPGLDLRGVIQGQENDYTLWIDDGSRQEHINIIAHELVHLEQYRTKTLYYDGFYVYWNSNQYDLKEFEYSMRPWESDAFYKEISLEKEMRSILY